VEGTVLLGTLVGEVQGQRRRLRTADLRWRGGVWLGRHEGADEHIIGAEYGARFTRSIQRRPPPGKLRRQVDPSDEGLSKDPEVGTPKGRPASFQRQAAAGFPPSRDMVQEALSSLRSPDTQNPRLTALGP
jgi:hypothetical protein